MTDKIEMPEFTLGWELEASRRARHHYEGIEVGHDGSVSGDGLEYRVKRDLAFKPRESLAALRKLATDPEIQTNRSCGFHVHVGLVRPSRRLHAWAAWFVTLARELEGSAFMAVPESRRGNNYCRKWSQDSGSVMSRHYVASKSGNACRYQWVNPVEIFRPGGIRTIEVRLMGDCHRYTYLASWVAACRLMAMSAWALAHDPSRLEIEKKELQAMFLGIERSFLRGPFPMKAAIETTVLIQRSGLGLPHERPLSFLLEMESSIAQEKAYESERERNDRRNLVKMKRYIRAEQEQRREGVVASVRDSLHPFCVGDTVRCLSAPPDGGLTPGLLYRVTGVNPGSSVRVINNGANQWNVNIRHLELAERREELCAAF